ncbi:MAG: hydrogenase small subunit [Bacillota bacterium]
MFSRREFLKLCMQGTAALVLSRTLLPELAQAAAVLGRRTPLVWLEADTCAGNIISFMNGVDPGLEEVVFDLFELRFNTMLMASQGALALDVLEDLRDHRAGEYILVVEGTIPSGSMAVLAGCEKREFSAEELLGWLAPRARAVVAAGTCAAYGGLYAARPNPSGSRAIGQLLPGRVINVPGCPIHPDWMLGTLAHLLLYGEPELDSYRRPIMFFSRTVHEQCPRRGDFQRGCFADYPGDAGCYYRIGCKGPVTHADCPTRQWNHYQNWPIEANTPCIGCTSPQFPDGTGPFFRHLPDLHFAGRSWSPRGLARAGLGATLGAVGLHLAGGLATGRVQEKWGRDRRRLEEPGEKETEHQPGDQG